MRIPLPNGNNPNLPNYEKPYFQAILPILEELKDIWIGKEAWAGKSNSRFYLPPEEEEPVGAYAARLNRSRFERRFRDILDKDFSGLLSKFELSSDVHPSILESEENFDNCGNSIQIVLRELDRKALRDGVVFAHIEFDKDDGTIVTEADRRTKNRRPYLRIIDRANLINWKLDYSNGKTNISLAVIREYVEDAVGEYGSTEILQYRVLRPGTFEVYRLSTSSKEGNPILIDAGQTSLPYIPLVPYSLTSSDPWTAEFPFRDLAELNIELYQIHSEKREILHKCNAPTLVIEEVPNNFSEPTFSRANADLGLEYPRVPERTITIGPNSCLFNVKAAWVEPSGRAIEQTIAEEKRIQETIDRKAIGFLSGSLVPKTATEVVYDSTSSEANLASLAHGKESAVAEIFRIWADYEESPIGGNITIDKRILKRADSWRISDITEAISLGIISRKFGFSLMKFNKFIPETFSEEEIELELQGNNTF